MEKLRQWILREAEVLGPEFLRVDGILNHRIEPGFIELVGFGFVIEKVFARGRDALQRFDVPVTTLAPILAMNAENGTIEFAEERA